MATEGGVENGRPAEDLSPWILLVAGFTYPGWRVFAPAGAVDPLPAWLAVSGCFFSVVLLNFLGLLSRSTLLRLVPGLASLVALHFYLLASFNDMSPFYAVGSTMAGLAPILFIRSRPAMFLYAGFITALSTVLYLEAPDPRKLPYWGSLAPVLAFGYQQIASRARYHQQLEDAIADRTRRLSDAYHHLRAETERRGRLEDEIRTNQKMEAIGRLAGGIAHDFNNVITTIGVYAELLEKGLPPAGAHRTELQYIRAATRQAAALTRQLLTVGRRSPVQLEVVDLEEIVDSTAPVLDQLVGAGIEVLISRCGEGNRSILANTDQVRHILINLVTNARDAMSGSGRIRIETAPAKPGELLALKGDSEAASKAYVRLSVEDTGEGMGPDTLTRIFDPFFTTKQPDKGSGLGLAIVHGMVSQAGGFVRVRSEPGSGSRFDLYWPPVEKGAIAPGSPVPAEAGRETILLVDDEAPLRLALARALRIFDYHVVEAPDAEAALEIVLGGELSPDLVVTDVVLGRTDGIELANRLREASPQLPVLLISAHLDEHLLRHRADGCSFLAKPFSVAELIESVREVLGDAPLDAPATAPRSNADRRA